MIKSAYIVPHPPMILPEIGHGRQAGIRSTIEAYEKIARDIAEIKPETIVFISPHSLSYADYIHIAGEDSATGNFNNYGASVSFSADYDTELALAISNETASKGIRAGTLGAREDHKALDHGVMVPMYFINKKYKDYKAVRVSISGLPRKDHYRLGQCIKNAAEYRNIVIIASGDLSHKLTQSGPYGFDPHGPEFDKKITGAMAEADFLEFLNIDNELCEAAAECGLRAFIIMSGALDGTKLKTEFMSYEGTFGVGYAICAYYNQGSDPERSFLESHEQDIIRKMNEVRDGEGALVRLARESLESYIRTGNQMRIPAGLPDELTDKKAGVFVSIKKHGKLRGCIGTISPAKGCIAEEIITNAISSGIRDSRFKPIMADELGDLVYSVDVLGDAERIKDKSDLDVKRYGVIVTSGFKRGLLLPNLDGVDSVDEQINIALRKAGINSEESYTMERFEVARHK